MRMGARIEQILKDRGMSQADLLKKIPDMEPGTLSALIVRKSRFSENALAIARALGVSLEYLIFGEESDESQAAPKDALSASDVAELVTLFAACDQRGRQSILETCRAQADEFSGQNRTADNQRQLGR